MNNRIKIFCTVVFSAVVTKFLLMPLFDKTMPQIETLALISLFFIPLLMIKEKYFVASGVLKFPLQCWLCLSGLFFAISSAYFYKNGSVGLCIFFATLVALNLIKAYFMSVEKAQFEA